MHNCHEWLLATSLDTVDFRTFPSSHQVLLFSTALKSQIISLHFSKPSSNFLFCFLLKSLLRPTMWSPPICSHLPCSLTSSPFTPPHPLCSPHKGPPNPKHALVSGTLRLRFLYLNICLQISAWIIPSLALASAHLSPSQRFFPN